MKNRPSHCNDQCGAEKNLENASLQPSSTSTHRACDKSTNPRAEDNSNHRDKVEVEEKKSYTMPHCLQGILFIEKIRNARNDEACDYFISYEGFWDGSLEKTQISVKGLFNYLRQFPLNNDEIFLNQVLNNHLELKLWKKTQYSENKLVATTRIPLHQFFIAFHDTTMINHLSNNSLPVISFDSWANFLTPLSNEVFCESKILIAVGSESQIDYLKLLRNLGNTTLRHPIPGILPVDGGFNLQMEDATNGVQPCLKNKLSAFIASLSQKLPENVNQSSNELLSTHTTSSEVQKTTQIGNTAELLDSLQKALQEPPPTPSVRSLLQCTDSLRSSNYCSLSQEKVRTRVNINFAVNLKKIPKKKQNRKRGSSATQKIEFEPAVYATFESMIEKTPFVLLPETIVKSHEGLVHCTKVVRGCEPHWTQTFDVFLLLDMFQNPQKKFIVKIWRKVSQDSEMKPTPFVDAVIGFCSVDLSVLMTGLPVLSGYYNIVDFSGKVHGQINMALTPQDNLLQNQNSIFHENIPMMASIAEDSNLLSRTLKRKFTELDEITQRLKAR